MNTEKPQEINTVYALAGVASFAFPGLGQLITNRKGRMFAHFFIAVICWAISIEIADNALNRHSPNAGALFWSVLFVLIGHYLAADDAANWYRPKWWKQEKGDEAKS